MNDLKRKREEEDEDEYGEDDEERDSKRRKIPFDNNTFNWKKFLSNTYDYLEPVREFYFSDYEIVPLEAHGEALLTILNTLDLVKIYGEKFLSFTPEKSENLQKQLEICKYSEYYSEEDEEEEIELVKDVKDVKDDDDEDNDDDWRDDRGYVYEFENWELGYVCAYYLDTEFIYLFDYKNLDYVIVGCDSSHPFIYCNNFSYTNSDGSGPRLVNQRRILTPAYLLDKMQFHFRSFCNLSKLNSYSYFNSKE